MFGHNSIFALCVGIILVRLHSPAHIHLHPMMMITLTVMLSFSSAATLRTSSSCRIQGEKNECTPIEYEINRSPMGLRLEWITLILQLNQINKKSICSPNCLFNRLLPPLPDITYTVRTLYPEITAKCTDMIIFVLIAYWIHYILYT